MTETPADTVLAPGALVVINGRLGRIVKATRRGPVDGYSVSTAVESREGTAPHFAQAHLVQPAVLGVNVCRRPRGECWCGLVHIDRPEQLASKECL